MMSERRNKLNCYPKIFIHPSSEKKIFEKILGTKNLKGINILLKPKNIVEKIFEKFFTSRYYKKKFKALLQINEKVTILSLEDNNIHLLKAQKFVEKAKIVLFQNGWRDNVYYKNLEKNKKNIFIEAFFAQGKQQKRKISKLANYSFALGNIKNNFYFKTTNFKRNSILFISQYFPCDHIALGKRKLSENDFFYNVDLFLLQVLSIFCRKHELSLNILGRGIQNRNFEKDYFSRMNINFNLISPTSNLDTYSKIEQYAMLVTVDSNLGYEAAAKGLKTCFFPLRSRMCNLPDRFFMFPLKMAEIGFFWSCLPSQIEIYNILSNVFFLSKKIFQKEILKVKFDEFMVFDKNNIKTKEMLWKIIQK